jgi:hypothetical protein
LWFRDGLLRYREAKHMVMLHAMHAL